MARQQNCGKTQGRESGAMDGEGWCLLLPAADGATAGGPSEAQRPIECQKVVDRTLYTMYINVV